MTDTNVHPNLLNRKDIEEIKYSLENYFRARLDELSSSEKKKMEEINSSLYYLCTELNKKKRLEDLLAISPKEK